MTEYHRKSLSAKVYVLDANAVIRYFQMSAVGGGEKVRALLELAQKGPGQVLMSAVNLGEVRYVMLRHANDGEVSKNIDTLRRVISIVDVNAEQAIQAADLKHQYKLAYADSFAAALALSLGATVVSADSSFEKLGKRLKWIRLPAYSQK